METKFVTFSEILDARDKKSNEIQMLLRKFNKPVVWFAMDIEGPLRNTPMIRQAFDKGLRDLKAQFIRMEAQILHEEVTHSYMGNFASFVTDLDPMMLKNLSCELEDETEAGLLYQIEIYAYDSQRLRMAMMRKLPRGVSPVLTITREQIQLPPKVCPVCGARDGKCSLQTGHTSEECHRATQRILLEGVYSYQASVIAETACKALLYETSVTPKPGLIDRVNNGGQSKKDFYTIMSGCAPLFPYFEECARLGQSTAYEKGPETLKELRTAGKQAERRMLQATRGIPINKGAIFTLGMICAACGRIGVRNMGDKHREDPNLVIRANGTANDDFDFLADHPLPFGDCDRICDECGQMTRDIIASDLEILTEEEARTIGEKLFLEYGITGIRGEFAEGLPSVRKFGVPALKEFLQEKRSYDEAGALTLLALMGYTVDTSMIECSNLETQQKMSKEAAEIFRAFSYGGSTYLRNEMLHAMDEDYNTHGYLPKGSGDLLAASFLIYFLTQGENNI